MCIDISASLCFDRQLSTYFLHGIVFIIIIDFFYTTLCASGDYPLSVLFRFLIVISFPLFFSSFCLYLSPKDTAPPTQNHRFGTGLTVAAYGCVIFTPVDTRTWNRGGAHGTGRTKSPCVRFCWDKITRNIPWVV